MADITNAAPTYRAKLLGFQSTVISIAYALGPAVGGFLADAYGARTSFFIVGGAALITSFGFSFLPETLKKRDGKEVDPGASSPKNKEDDMPSTWEVYKPLLASPNQQAVMAMSFAVASSYRWVIIHQITSRASNFPISFFSDAQTRSH